MKQNFIRVSIKTPKDNIEQAYSFLYQIPEINGLEEKELANEQVSIDAYIPLGSKREYLDTIIKNTTASLKNIDLSFHELEYDPTTQNEWKKYFKPQKIGRNIVIKPSWEPYAPNTDDIVITIDPGIAFGTGLHETTRSVLIMLEDLINEYKSSGFKLERFSLLDAGTGSGILAITAHKMGIKTIKAIDYDFEAVEIATHNIMLNGIMQRDIKTQTIPLIAEEGSYDIVIANILSEVLIESKEKIASLLKNSESRLIISGILCREETKILKDFMNTGFQPINIVRMGEWCTILLKLK